MRGDEGGGGECGVMKEEVVNEGAIVELQGAKSGEVVNDVGGNGLMVQFRYSLRLFEEQNKTKTPFSDGGKHKTKDQTKYKR